MFPVGQALSKPQERLLKLFRQLGEKDRESLLAFAEFLVQREDSSAEEGEAQLATPLDIPRPEDESVIAAIKRLSKTYPMLDTSTMLNETSTLMSGHLLQGRAANDVIDDLEALFQKQYLSYRGD